MLCRVLSSPKRPASSSSSRLPAEESFWGMGGRLYWLLVFYTWARSWARWRTKKLRRRKRSRVGRMARG